MAKLTKAARRRAALKGWRNRKPKRTGSSKKKKNPSAGVKGRKVKGGRAVMLHGFTGTVTRKANGQVIIRGKARKR